MALAHFITLHSKMSGSSDCDLVVLHLSNVDIDDCRHKTLACPCAIQGGSPVATAGPEEVLQRRWDLLRASAPGGGV